MFNHLTPAGIRPPFAKYSHAVEVPASDEAHLIAWLSKRLGARLRDIERHEDPDGRIYPRMKPSDDATAVLFEIREASG